MASFHRTGLGPGMNFYVEPTRKFKRTTVSLFFHLPLEADRVSGNALLPAVLRRGTRSHPTTRDIEAALAGLYGATLFTDVVKVGDRHTLGFTLELPADRFTGEAGLLERGFEFLGELVARPLARNGGFDPEYVSQEQALQEKRIARLADNKPAYAAQRCVEEMFRGEPFGLYELGTVEGVRALGPRSLWRLHQEVLARSPVDIFVVGDVDADAVAELARRTFRWERGEAWQLPATAVYHQPDRARRVVEEQEMGQGWLFLGFRTNVAHADPDYHALMLYHRIVGGTTNSKLFLNVRERASLAYAANARLNPSKGLLLAFAGIDPARFEQALEIMEAQFEAMRRGDFTPEEVLAARESAATALRTVVDQPRRYVERTMRGIVDGRPDTPDEAIAGLERVDAGQITAVARKVRLDTVYFLKGTRVKEAAAGG